MKRNYPNSSNENLDEDNELLSGKLDDLFEQASQKHRRIPISNKGTWIASERHVKLDSTKGILSHLCEYHRELKYFYLAPFQALFCLDSNQLLIFNNGSPLSLVEAYDLLIKDDSEFKQYRVFQHLNRLGFICLMPVVRSESCGYLEEDQSTKPTSPDTADGPISLSDICAEGPLSQELLVRLRVQGPRECTEGGQVNPSDELEVTFDVYDRASFKVNKPSRGKQGNPSYKLIVCDRPALINKPPSCKQLNWLNSKHGSSAGKLLFALLDEDSSICFTQFKPMNPSDLFTV